MLSDTLFWQFYFTCLYQWCIIRLILVIFFFVFFFDLILFSESSRNMKSVFLDLFNSHLPVITVASFTFAFEPSQSLHSTKTAKYSTQIIVLIFHLRRCWKWYKYSEDHLFKNVRNIDYINTFLGPSNSVLDLRVHYVQKLLIQEN